MTSSAITLPQPLTIRGLNHIPPPPVRDFEAEFGGLLPEGKSIPSSWGVIRYYDFNPTPDPHARRVILIHGGGTPAIGMAPLGFKLLQTGNHVVTYDLWGHGNSSTPLEAHVPALLHAQLFELLSYLGWSTAHILGFSMGATILATFGAIHFHVIESVTLVAGAGLTRRSDPWVANLKTAGDLGGELLDGQKIMDFVEGNPPLRDGWKDRLRQGQIDTEPVLKWERDNHKGHIASVVSMFRDGLVFDQHESYRKLAEGNLHTLVILGEKDNVVEVEYTRTELMRLGWNGDIKIVEDATHEIVRSHTGEVAALVCNFWESLTN